MFDFDGSGNFVRVLLDGRIQRWYEGVGKDGIWSRLCKTMELSPALPMTHLSEFLA